MDCNLTFSVKFGSNNVQIVTDGPAYIHCDKWDEDYEVEKTTPNMMMKNVIIGTRYVEKGSPFLPYLAFVSNSYNLSTLGEFFGVATLSSSALNPGISLM
jgi:hypothetical protein